MDCRNSCCFTVWGKYKEEVKEGSPSTGCCRGSWSCGILCLCTVRKKERWLVGGEKRWAVCPESKSSKLGNPRGRLQGLFPGFACLTSEGSSAPNPRSGILRSVSYERHTWKISHWPRMKAVSKSSMARGTFSWARAKYLTLYSTRRIRFEHYGGQSGLLVARRALQHASNIRNNRKKA